MEKYIKKFQSSNYLNKIYFKMYSKNLKLKEN